MRQTSTAVLGCLSLCLGFALAQSSAPGPRQYHVPVPVAAPPLQQYAYGSPPGVVGGLFKNLTVPPTAYVSFQTVVQNIALTEFDKATQTYYINSIASYLRGSASQVVILKIDGSARHVASGPPQANQSLIHQGPIPAPQVPAAGPMYRSMAPAPAIRSRSLLQVHTGEAAAASAAAGSTGPVLYIYTAVTLDTSGVGAFVESLFDNTTGVLDPQGIAGPEAVTVQDVITGIANPGYTPHVAAGSPIVSFQVQLTDSRLDDTFLFPLFPLIVLNTVLQPDLTAISLRLDSDDGTNWTILMAVAFNGLPQTNAVTAATNFAKKLNASATNSSVVGFVTPSFVTIQSISDVKQQAANAAGGFLSEAYDGILYNPTVVSGSTGSTVTPNTNAVVNFRMRIASYSEAAWTGSDGTSPSGQDRYLYTLTTWLRNNTSPYAYAQLLGYTVGSIDQNVNVVLPYTSTNPSSVQGANQAVAILTSTLTSNSASIFDPTIFGATTASGITSSGLTTTSPSPPPPATTTKKSHNKGAIAGGVIGGIAGVTILGVAGYFIYKKVSARRPYGQ
ncbi:hypothetical protein WJX74_009946 [Apatococcus lobatus]|uniref:Uncharacterized protein n=1 Tax=Apatococcus lobatus TaxID=904363 RepID=A0AAW1RHK6_9CHLO